MSPFAAILCGGAGGFGGAWLAHALQAFGARRWQMDAWLKGPYGPPFFPVALSTAILYGCVGLALSRRLKEGAAGFGGPLIGIAAPMAILTRTQSGWAYGWYFALLGLFVAATWGTIAALGAMIARSWLGALTAAGGSLAAYAILAALARLAPALRPAAWPAASFLPPPIELLDGLLSGAFLGLGISLAPVKESHEKASV